MAAQDRTIHEPEAELLSAENVIQDAERLQALFRGRQVEQQVPLLEEPPRRK